MKSASRRNVGAALTAAALASLSFDDRMNRLGFSECGRLNIPLPKGYGLESMSGGIKQENTMLPNGLERVNQVV
ncbi:MAG TPA: hypothetical protein VFB79_15910, partial [Candidatus Angelobacter sp.]|nr:hypothetical protein [Candidatus Angelobacter sp.]